MPTPAMFTYTMSRAVLHIIGKVVVADFIMLIFLLGSVQKLHHPGTREGGVSEKMILNYVEGGRGPEKDDG